MSRRQAFVASLAMISRSHSDKVPSKDRHPSHLRGRDIGLYYAARNRRNDGTNASRLSTEERRQARIARHLLDEYPQRLKMSPAACAAMKDALSSLSFVSAHGYPECVDCEANDIDSRQRPNKRCDPDFNRNRKDPSKPLMMEPVALPAWNCREEIIDAVRENQVIVISGETGCGKTTQVPQFILDTVSRNDRVICTQPRRISAIGVAERVAAERGENVGATVGYQIRLEAVKRSETQLLFCTTGILLRRMQSDFTLDDIGCVIVDEVHERSIDTDFLLILLRDLLPKRPNLRIILMSATVDTSLFSNYFGGCPVIQIPGFTYDVKTYFLEDIIKLTGYVASDPLASGSFRRNGQRGGYSRRHAGDVKKRLRQRDTGSEINQLRQSCGSSYSDETLLSVSTLMNYSDGSIPMDLVQTVLEYIDAHMGDGAVLVFLPGWDDISRMNEILTRHKRFGDRNLFWVLCLHSLMPTANQRKIFQRPPRGMRKIVLSTNIAETSVTIDDVVFVIDTGRFKEKTYDPATNVACLLPEWISRASAHQRRGRAGRVQRGYCFRLYASSTYSDFKEYQEPELLRTPLECLCLQVKAMKIKDIGKFLGRALQQPDEKAVQNAVELLRVIGALYPDREKLTPLGTHLSKLPVDPKLGKMLLYAVMFKCLDPILTIASSLGFRNPFVIPTGKKSEVDSVKLKLAGPHLSDHAAILNAFNGWRRAGGSTAGAGFAVANFMSHSTLKMIEEMRQQFVDLLSDTGFLETGREQKNARKDWSLNAFSDNWPVVKGVLVAGLFPSLCRIDYGRSRVSFFTRNDGRVKPHPSSVLKPFQDRFLHRWTIFYDKLRSTDLFLLDLTEVSPLAICLFGGDLEISPASNRISVETGDGHFGSAGKLPSHLLKRPWVTFEDPDRIGRNVIELRKYIDVHMQQMLCNPRAMGVFGESDRGILISNVVSQLLEDAEKFPYHDIRRPPDTLHRPLPKAEDDGDGNSSDGTP